MAMKTKAKKKDKRAKPVPAGEVMTLAEAAVLLRVTEDQLRMEAQAGGMPAKRVAGEWRFGRSAILMWLRCEEPSPPSRKERLLAVVGCLADDDTLEPMVEEIYRERKQSPLGAAL